MEMFTLNRCQPICEITHNMRSFQCQGICNCQHFDIVLLCVYIKARIME